MKKHFFDGVPGKITFHNIKNLDRLVLEAAEIADVSYLWIYNKRVVQRQRLR